MLKFTKVQSSFIALLRQTKTIENSQNSVQHDRFDGLLDLQLLPQQRIQPRLSSRLFEGVMKQ
jgi:hypothetical protein